MVYYGVYDAKHTRDNGKILHTRKKQKQHRQNNKIILLFS